MVQDDMTRRGEALTPEHMTALNPFGYFPEIISRIGGIGAGHVIDPQYVFHTPYGTLPARHASYRLRFLNLRATKGTLVLFVNELSAEPTNAVATVQTLSLGLRELMHRDGELVVEVHGRPDRTYAAFAGIYEETDAVADGLSVTLGPAEPDVPPGFSRSDVGEGHRPVARLVSQARITLADPVSQICTAAQFDEPAYRSWATLLHLPDDRRRDHWEEVFVLQALQRYGALRDGAQAIGFGVRSQRIPTALAALGLDVLATRTPEGIADHDPAAIPARSPHPEICSDERYARAIRTRTVDMAEIPRDLQQFDMAWGAGILAHVPTLDQGLRFIEQALLCLRPGGVGVFTADFAVEAGEPGSMQGGPRFHRREIERLALSLITFGHQVAQLRYGPPPTPGARSPAGTDPVTSLGLVIRRRPSS